MEAEYIKDMQGSYLVLEGIEGCTNLYQVKMLLNNNISGILEAEIRCIDEKDLFYYNITSKEKLLSAYEKQSLSYDLIKHLLLNLIEIIENSSEFLLSENDFVLEPEYIYMDQKSKKPCLCYYVGYQTSLNEQLNNLIEYLMNKVDYKDEKAVLLVYSLYKEIKENNATFDKLKIELNKNLNHSLKNRKNDDLNVISKPELDSMKELKENKNQNSFNTANHKMTFADEIKEEKEVLCYSKKSLILAFISFMASVFIFIIAFRLKLFHNSFGVKVDMIKIMCFIIIAGCLEGLIISKLFNKKNKMVKIISTVNNAHIDNQNSTLHKDSFDIHPHMNEYSDDKKFKSHIQSNKGNIVDNNIQPYGQHKGDKNVQLDSWRDGDQDLQASHINNDMESVGTEILWQEQETDEENHTMILQDLSLNKTTYYLESHNILESKKVPIDSSTFIIGKYVNGVNYRIDDSSISRFHAKIILQEDIISITDLGSTNGTYLNGVKIQEQIPCELSLNDEIRFSKYEYILRGNDVKNDVKESTK